MGEMRGRESAAHRLNVERKGRKKERVRERGTDNWMGDQKGRRMLQTEEMLKMMNL